MLAELLWLPVVATHQLHCRALRGWELPSRSKKDQRVEWTMGRNLRWRIRRTGLQQRRPSRSTTRSIWGGVPQGRCGKLRCAKRWNCPRCSKGAGFYWTGPPTMWLGAHAGLRWSMPCGRVLNAATKCGRKLLGSKWWGGVPLFKHDELHTHISKRMPQLLFCRCWPSFCTAGDADMNTPMDIGSRPHVKRSSSCVQRFAWVDTFQEVRTVLIGLQNLISLHIDWHRSSSTLRSYNFLTDKTSATRPATNFNRIAHIIFDKHSPTDTTPMVKHPFNKSTCMLS